MTFHGAYTTKDHTYIHTTYLCITNKAVHAKITNMHVHIHTSVIHIFIQLQSKVKTIDIIIEYWIYIFKHVTLHYVIIDIKFNLND